MVRLFDENERYTQAALDLDAETAKAVQVIFDRYVTAGYSVRDVSFLMQKAINELELTEMVGRRVRRVGSASAD